MTEWFKVPVLKTGVFVNTGGSNPSLSLVMHYIFEGMRKFILFLLRYSVRYVVIGICGPIAFYTFVIGLGFFKKSLCEGSDVDTESEEVESSVSEDEGSLGTEGYVQPDDLDEDDLSIEEDRPAFLYTPFNGLRQDVVISGFFEDLQNLPAVAPTLIEQSLQTLLDYSKAGLVARNYTVMDLPTGRRALFTPHLPLPVNNSEHSIISQFVALQDGFPEQLPMQPIVRFVYTIARALFLNEELFTAILRDPLYAGIFVSNPQEFAVAFKNLALCQIEWREKNFALPMNNKYWLIQQLIERADLDVPGRSYANLHRTDLGILQDQLSELNGANQDLSIIE